MKASEKKPAKFRIYMPESILANDKGIVKFPIVKIRQSKQKKDLVVVAAAYGLEAVYQLSSDFTTYKWLGYIGASNPIKGLKKPDKQQFVEFLAFNKQNPCQPKV